MAILLKKLIYFVIISFFLQAELAAQRGFPTSGGGGFNPQRLGGRDFSSLGQGGGSDSLRRRDKFEDSITVYLKYLDSTSYGRLDSSIKDFRLRYPVPATNIYLGNVGNASRSLLFSPHLNAGWDAGFHSFDIYRWKKETTRFFHTTRPYSEINYLLGGRSEQIIELLQTQNVKTNWNISFNYRLINSPGFFKNQKTNHNNYIVTSWYQSLNKRYNNYFMLVSNKLQSGESGGIRNDGTDYLNDIVYKDRFNIPTNIGGDPQFGRDFFSTNIPTGTKYTETVYLLRQQYDFGKKDSLISDSTIYYLFYPRLRFEHTFSLEKNKYLFQDFVGDSAYYRQTYDTALRYPTDTFELRENWTVINNDFSIYQFPDIKNQQQFVKLGILIQNIKGRLSRSTENYYNLMGHAEYRNKTRNQKWDLFLEGKLYLNGNNFGDYEALAGLRRLLSKKLGYLQLGFQNVNRTPSYFYNSRSSFYLLKNEVDFKKENITHLFASVYQPGKLNLSGHYYLLTNYTYIKNYYQLSQESSLFNVLQIALEKSFKIGKKFAWHSEIYFQQTIGDAPLNLPLVFTRNRFAYEGPTAFKNLNIATGIEIKYHTPYKADGYSPALGQFFYQDSLTIKNQVPEISAYLHFRIRPMKFFIRAENLNTVRYLGNINFTNNLIETPGYPMPGLQLRLGVYWSFVN